MVDQKKFWYSKKKIWYTKKKFGRVGQPKKYLVYQKKIWYTKKKFGQPKKCEIDRTIGIPKRLTKSTWTSLVTVIITGILAK